MSTRLADLTRYREFQNELRITIWDNEQRKPVTLPYVRGGVAYKDRVDSEIAPAEEPEQQRYGASPPRAMRILDLDRSAPGVVLVDPCPHPDPDKCPSDCDSKLAHEMMRQQAEQQRESMKGSVRIKDLDCSTAKPLAIDDDLDRELEAVRKERWERLYAGGEDVFVAGPVTDAEPIKPMTCAACGYLLPDNREAHHCPSGSIRKTPGGEVALNLICGYPIREVLEVINCLKYAKGVVSDQSLSEFVSSLLNREPMPMTLARAVEVLNERSHRGFNDWGIFAVAGRPVMPSVLAVTDNFKIIDFQHNLTEFEAIAIAEKLEREGR